MPTWRRFQHDRRDRGLLSECAQTFNPGHERFAFGERFRTPAAREMKRLSTMNQIVNERVDEGCFSQPDIASDADDSTVPLTSLFVCMAQGLAFKFAADDWVGSPSGSRVDSICRRLIIENTDRGNKTVTRLRNRFDISVVARLLLENLAKRGHISVEVSFFDKAVRPNILHQFFFTDRLSRPLEQDKENSENRRRNGPG